MPASSASELARCTSDRCVESRSRLTRRQRIGKLARRACRHPRLRSQHGEQHPSHDSPCFCGFQAGPPSGRQTSACSGRRCALVPARHPGRTSTFWGQIDLRRGQGAPRCGASPPACALQGNSGRISSRCRSREGEGDIGVSTGSGGAGGTVRAENAKRLSAPPKLAANPGKRARSTRTISARARQADRAAGRDLQRGDPKTPAVQQQIPRSVRARWCASGGGGLGSSGGMALGTKLARPEHMAIQIVGDGSFYFNVSGFGGSRCRSNTAADPHHVLDNGGWSAVKESTLRVYRRRGQAEDEFEGALAITWAFARSARLSCAYGEKVTDPGAGFGRDRALPQEVRGRPHRDPACFVTRL